MNGSSSMRDVAPAKWHERAKWRERLWPERLLGFAEISHARACTLLILFALICFLPGFATLPPMDRDEPRFAQASKQMIESGDFVDIRFQDEARHKKPVGIYWLQSAAVAAADAVGVTDAHRTIAIYRLPSLAGALAAVLLTYWAGLAFGRRREAFLAAAMMAGSIILMVEARLAKTDAMLLACSVAAMGALARAYLARGISVLPVATVVVFWSAIALGVLIKGPLVVMFAGLAAVTLSIRERSGHWLWALRPGLGLLLTLLVVLPWFVAITLKSGGGFFAQSAGHDMIGKIGTAQTQHWAPPGTYLLVFFATFWPAAILTAIAVPFAWINRRTDEVAFILAWVLPSWLVFEAVPTKLPHYVMPLYPALAILTTMAIARGFVGPNRPFAKTATVLLPAIPLALLLALLAAGAMFGSGVPLPALVVTAVAIVLAAWAWREFVRGAPLGAALIGLMASAAVSVGVLGLAQPAMTAFRISPNLAAAATALTCPNPAFGTLGYREPSLVFLVGTDLDMLADAAEAAQFLQSGPCRMVFVERRFEADVRAAVETWERPPALITRVQGFNINGGKRLDIGVYAVQP
jgi:4-amino-4-deoxy-L-arabinose transferase-like glycosyltransferase